MFYLLLHDCLLCFSASTDALVTMVQGEEIRERAGSFGKSVSDNTRQRPKALTLNTSRSENALSSHLVSGSRSSGTHRDSPTVEEESSPESTGMEQALIHTMFTYMFIYIVRIFTTFKSGHVIL